MSEGTVLADRCTVCADKWRVGPLLIIGDGTEARCQTCARSEALGNHCATCVECELLGRCQQSGRLYASYRVLFMLATQ
jgi:hypothetical protein